MKTLGFIIISFLSISPLTGQQIDSASVVEKAQEVVQGDSARSKYLPTGVRVGFDLISFGQGVINNGVQAITQGEFREIQFSADIDFYRYFLNVEYGRFETELTVPDRGFYEISGSHFKVGPDVNFLHRDPDGSALFFGLRYSWNNFSDRQVYNFTNNFWGDGSNEISNINISANWIEITTGLKVKLTKVIWLGYTARFKFGYSTDTFSDKELVPHWIPGYGRADENSRWGLDYWIIFKLPFDGKKIKENK